MEKHVNWLTRACSGSRVSGMRSTAQPLIHLGVSSQRVEPLPIRQVCQRVQPGEDAIGHESGGSLRCQQLLLGAGGQRLEKGVHSGESGS